MNINLDKFFLALIFIFPILLITGPALPDITLTFFVLFYLIKFFTSIKLNINFKNWFSIALIFCLGSLVSSLFANDFKLNAISSSLPYIRFILFCFLLNCFFLKSPFNYFMIINIIGLVIFFVSIDICIQYFFGKDIFGYETTPVRNSGPFGDELKGGSFISKLFLPTFTLFYFLSTKSKIYKIITPILFISCLFAIIFSGERASLLIFLFSNVLFMSFIYFYNLKKFFLFVTLFSIILLLSFKFLLSNNLKERYFMTTYNDVKNFESILNSHYGAHYITAYNIFLDHPILGVGQNNYRNICSDNKYSKLQSARIDDRCSTHPHNYYIQILSDLGVINFVIFLFLIFSIFFKIYKNKKQTERIIYYGKIFSLMVIFWPLLPTGSFYNNWNSALNWFIIALSLCLIDKSYSNKLFFFLKYKKDNK